MKLKYIDHLFINDAKSMKTTKFMRRRASFAEDAPGKIPIAWSAYPSLLMVPWSIPSSLAHISRLPTLFWTSSLSCTNNTFWSPSFSSFFTIPSQQWDNQDISYSVVYIFFTAPSFYKNNCSTYSLPSLLLPSNFPDIKSFTYFPTYVPIPLLIPLHNSHTWHDIRG